MLRACVSADDFVKQLDAHVHCVLPCTFFFFSPVPYLAAA